MSRQIKFRAWDIHLNKYVKFNLIGRVEFNDNSYVFEQFIGLTDKNGKDIYEGDILVMPDGNPPEYSNSIAIVEYVGSCYCYRYTHIMRAEPIFNLVDFSAADNNAEIIGNIHENSDLI
jgi:uncharacterized phage protein (TIGR01671 family)